MSTVQIVGKPALSTSARRFVDHRDQESTDEAADAEDAHVESQPQAPQCIRDLVVEELLQANHGEDICNPEKNILRHQPPQAHRNPSVGMIHQTELSSSFEPLHLHQRCYHHGDERESHPGANPLQHGDAGRKPGELPSHGDEDAIVDRDGDDDGDADKTLQRRRRHLKLGADPPVQCTALLGEQS